MWQTEQVLQLLSDINGELAGEHPSQAPEYFIGSIVVCPGEDGVLDLIDEIRRFYRAVFEQVPFTEFRVVPRTLVIAGPGVSPTTPATMPW